ncbi:hypothetical protein JXJ21_19870 [candidate division KSB1 bacterium]|nr:hypothetical protein [candidate division KSB1 bacterium]
MTKKSLIDIFRKEIDAFRLFSLNWNENDSGIFFKPFYSANPVIQSV